MVVICAYAVYVTIKSENALKIEIFSFQFQFYDLKLPWDFRLFYVVEKLHEGASSYTYGTQGLSIAKKYYNDQQTYLQTNHQNDTFLSGKPLNTKQILYKNFNTVYDFY